MDQKELREQENRCIQEHAPACIAACPAHVDVRGLTAELSKGTLLPLSSCIASPSRSRALSATSVTSRARRPACGKTWVARSRSPHWNAPAWSTAARAQKRSSRCRANPKSVAVIGAGISGLTVAHDLARKGWGVVIYEASDRIGGGLWQTPPDILPRDVLVNDLKIIETLGVEIRLNTAIGRTGGNGHSTFLSRLVR